MPKVPAPVHGEGLSSVGPLPTEKEDVVRLAARMDVVNRRRPPRGHVSTQVLVQLLVFFPAGPLRQFGGVSNFHFQGVISNHSALQSIHIFPTSPVFRSRS